MNFETIKERVFKLRKNPELAQELFPEFGSLKASFKHAYAIYIDDGIITPVCGYITNRLKKNQEPGFKDDFRAYLERYRPENLEDTLFLLDSYNLSSQALGYPYRWEFCKFKHVKAVDDILAESKGILLWDHQMEQLFARFFPDYDKDIELRKAVNQKRPEVFDLAEKLKFDYGINLKDVLRERMIFSITCMPHYTGAKILFSHLANVAEGQYTLEDQD